MNKVKGLIKLLRFELPFAAGVCVLLGEFFAFKTLPDNFSITAGFFSVFFISASILASNDYFDVETDKINSPDRPVPSGLVTPGEALIFSIVLLIAGIVLSCMINITAFFIAAGLAFTGFLYNRYFKKRGLAGNLMVSFSVGMTFIYGGAIAGSPFNKEVIFFGVIAALIDLGEEIAADSMDMKGDLLINSTSLAIKYGGTAALYISSLIFLLVILLSFVPFILRWFKSIYLIPVGIMDIAVIYSTLKMINTKEDSGRKYIRLLYLGATLGILIFLIMKLLAL